MQNKRLPPILFGLLALLLIGPPETLRAETKLIQPVRLQLKWYHQFQFAGYYAADMMGYFQDAGLDVEFKEGGPQYPIVGVVVAGSAQYGVGDSGLINERVAGQPVVVLASIFQHSPNVLLSRFDRDIITPSDLRGKTVMLSQNHALYEVQLMLRKHGLSLEEVTIVPNTGRIDDIIEGRADAMMAYLTNEPNRMTERGITPSLLRPIEYGIDFYGDLLFTSEREIEQYPERVAAFRDASLKGWAYALEHPEEVVDYILKLPSRRGEVLSREHLLYEARQIRELMLPGLIDIGNSHTLRWQQSAELLSEFGYLPKTFDLTGFIYQAQKSPLLPYLTTRNVIITVLIMGLLATANLLWNLQLRRAVSAKTSLLQNEGNMHRMVANALRENKAQQQALLAAIPDMMVVTDEQGGFIEYHGSEEGLFAISIDDLTGCRIPDILPPGQAAVMEQEYKMLLETGQMVVSKFQLAVRGEPRHFERRLVRGGRRQVLILIRDITASYRLEERFRYLYREHRAITDSVPDILFKLDLQGRLTWWNEALSSRTGIPYHELSNRSILEFIDDRDKGHLHSALHKTHKEGAAEVEVLFLNIDGPAPVYYKAVALRDDNDELVGVVGIGRDISALRRSEERTRQLLLQNRNLTQRLFKVQEASRRRLAQELHDELGQWLTAIQAEAAAIQSRNDNHDETIQSGAEAISNLTIRMHQAMRGIIRELRPGLLDELGLEDSLNELISMTQDYHPDTVYSLDYEQGLATLADYLNTTIYRIVQESLTNINKHAEASEVLVELRAHEGGVLLTIDDDGKGIASQKVGMGFGLAGIRERALSANGRFELQSSELGGVRIYVALPLEIEEGNEELAWAKPEQKRGISPTDI